MNESMIIEAVRAAGGVQGIDAHCGSGKPARFTKPLFPRGGGDYIGVGKPFCVKLLRHELFS